jgi:hypothetical protein
VYIKLLKLMPMTFLAASSLLTANLLANINGILGSPEDISISVANSSFAPMTNVHASQARVSVSYQVNDESLEDEKINGIMEIYTANGSLIRSSSFPDGFVAKKRGGTEDFKTTIRDPTIKNLIANITFTDLERTDTLSNTVTVNLSFKDSQNGTSVADSAIEGEVADEVEVQEANGETKQESPLEPRDGEGEGGGEEQIQEDNDDNDEDDE